MIVGDSEVKYCRGPIAKLGTLEMGRMTSFPVSSIGLDAFCGTLDIAAFLQVPGTVREEV